MTTANVTHKQLDLLLQKNEIVLLDFWASWCGPCRAFAPIYERAAAKHPDVLFGKVDTEAEQQLAAYFQIRSIPTVMAFRQGVMVFAQPGVLPAEALDALISKIKALDMDSVRKHLSQSPNANP